MKKYLGVVILLILGTGAWTIAAFIPTQDVDAKIAQVAERLEQLIQDRGERYHGFVLQMLDIFAEEYQSSERAQYVAATLIFHLDAAGVAQVLSEYLGSYSIQSVTYGTDVSVLVNSVARIMHSNGLPNHDTGEFPNSGNPNAISEQDYDFTIPVDPDWHGDAANQPMFGVAVNGVFMEPETAEIVECGNSSWRIEAFQEMTDLGFDENNAHVQPGGLYHYHGVPQGLIEQLDGTDLVHIGFAADGYLVYYSKQNSFSPSYKIRSGQRQVSGACTYRGKNVNVAGAYDGTYVEDREYVAGLGDLDECNGTTIDGQYVYLLTDAYPYIPRCINGVGDSSFDKGPGGGGGGGQPGQNFQGPPPRGGAPMHPPHY